jgi:hypothetical protein
MGLFKSDLFRSLALGFVAGAIGLVAVMGSASLSDNVVPPAVAAQVEQR